jgi:hypothetical protein
MSGRDEFIQKYNIEFDSLVNIPKINTDGYYKQNYDVMYDIVNDRLFTLWHSPYKHFIYIREIGFITIDENIRPFYADYINKKYKSGL